MNEQGNTFTWIGAASMGSGSFSYGSSAFKISATISTLPSSSCLTFGKLKRGSNSLAASLFKMRTEDLFNNFGLMLVLVVSTTSTGKEFMLTNSVSSTSSEAIKRCTSSMNKSSSFSILLRKLAVASSSIVSTLVRTGVGGTGTAAGSAFKIFLGTALSFLSTATLTSFPGTVGFSNSAGHFPVFMNDGMASYICMYCSQYFEYSHKFKQVCKKGSNLLHQVPSTRLWSAD
uniref:Uncharacterized protein n=1 Tax=Glossina morsitans morsitans TaxID=37546 RepID=A0A1B0FPT4_GLOMM